MTQPSSNSTSPSGGSSANLPPPSGKRRREDADKDLDRRIRAVAEGTRPSLPTASERSAMVRPPGAANLPTFEGFRNAAIERAKKAFDEANRLYENGKYAEALPLINIALRDSSHVKNIFALNLRSQLLLLLSTPKEALKNIQQSLAFTSNVSFETVPTSIDDTKKLAMETISRLSGEELLSLSPTIIQAKAFLAQMTIEVLIRLGEFDAAVEVAKCFLGSELINHEAAAYFTEGILTHLMMAMDKLKRPEECLTAADKILARNSHMDALHRNIVLTYKASSLQQMGRNAEALGIAEEILQHESNAPLPLVCKAKCLCSLGRYEECLVVVEEFLKNGTNKSSYLPMLFLKVDILLELGKVSEALSTAVLASTQYRRVLSNGNSFTSSELEGFKELGSKMRMNLMANCHLDRREFPDWSK